MLVLTLGLLSKESAIVIPLLAIVLWLDFARVRRTPGLSILLGGVVVCVVYIAMRMTFVAVPDSYALEPTRYLIKEALARPVATFALPWTTAVFNSWPVIPFLWVVTCILVIALFAWSRNTGIKPEVIARCLVAALVAVLPLYSILFITSDLENGRYLYLSSAFWVVALVGMAIVPGRLNRVSSFVFIAVIAVSVVGVQVHLAPWREAARVRERVLAAARDVLATTPCAAVTLGGAPDSVRGAFVFRNGLSEAISSSTKAVPAAPSTEIGCHFRWTGSTFEKTGNLSGANQASLAPVH
jgi:hypothetical protein